MASTFLDTDKQCRKLIEDAKKGVFYPVYLLMGTESYYVDKVCDEIINNAIDESSKDFNELICYGSDVEAETVITTARRFPMMADKQLVVLKEAQLMKSLEQLSFYCAKPLDSTIFVILMHGASADKRKALYKSVQKEGIIVESNTLRDYEVANWILAYYQERGLQIDHEAAALLAEFSGTDLSRIAVETDKILKNLPEGTNTITAEDIEHNVGISREFSVFELTKELSYKNPAKALRIATYIGDAPKFAMPMAVSALFSHFYRVLKYGALLSKNRNPDNSEKVKVLGVNPYFFKEYDAALANYPLVKCMGIISMLTDYDYKGKGGEVGEATQGQLLVELVSKILTI